MAKAIGFVGFHAKAMWRGAPLPVAATAHMCATPRQKAREANRVPRAPQQWTL